MKGKKTLVPFRNIKEKLFLLGRDILECHTMYFTKTHKKLFLGFIIVTLLTNIDLGTTKTISNHFLIQSEWKLKKIHSCPHPNIYNIGLLYTAITKVK